jgi:hypothetical protein
MTSLHPFPPTLFRSEFEPPSNRGPTYSEGGGSGVNGVTQSPRRWNRRRVICADRRQSLTHGCKMFNRSGPKATVKWT